MTRAAWELLQDFAAPEVLARLGDRVVAGLTDDSRQAVPDGLFVAIRGTAVDGREFIADALQRGARIVVGSELPPCPGAEAIEVPDARRALAQLAFRWYRLDEVLGQRMQLIGITGTNGKTTTAIMTRAILQAAGHKCGLLGTVRYDLCGRSVTAGVTTPGALELAGYLRECADNGARFAVMEVSSHALDQQRVAGLPFAVAAFTNLSGDHLDYHGTFESYRAAKALLFSGLSAGATAVVNRDDANAAAMLAQSAARPLWYSIAGDAEITGRVSRDTVRGTVFRLRIDGTERVLENALVGRHNVYNALAAAGVAHALGIPLDAVETGLANVRNIPGRLQRVPCAGAADVFVDYAHTDDALRNVLSVLKPLARRRLIAVFGCGGDRDRTKRPRMAQAAAESADHVIVTSDNPRTEDPQTIIADIVSGFAEQRPTELSVEPDRAAAIHLALRQAGDGDVVIIAGKGHETYQILGTRRVHFDDVEVALQAAADLARVRAGEA